MLAVRILQLAKLRQGKDMMKRRTKFLHWVYKLSWKKLIGFGGFALVAAMVPLSLEVATNPTRTRSEAALINPTPQPVTENFETPTGPPKIFLVDHFFGKVGDAVLIHGENLGGLHEKSSVSLAGQKILEENLVSWTGSYIEFIVPEGARSGLVEIEILGQKASWSGVFFVTDTSIETELRLKPNEANKNQAELVAKDIDGGRELLVWLLIFRGEGDITITPRNGVKLNTRQIDFPVGKVYEVKIGLNSKITTGSLSQLVSLVNIEKHEDQLVGVARGELSIDGGLLKPLKVNPLYVSF